MTNSKKQVGRKVRTWKAWAMVGSGHLKGQLLWVDEKEKLQFDIPGMIPVLITEQLGRKPK